jgi:hypothetical protein
VTRPRHVPAPAWLAGLLLTCGPPPPEAVSVTLTVLDALEAPVPGASFWLDGRELGQSDARGELRVRLQRDAVGPSTLRHACPADHRADQPSRELALRGLSSSELRLIVRCQPLQQATPLVVRAHTPEPAALPVLVDGQPTDLTDSAGIAHSLLRLRPGQAVEVSLDTREYPALRPRSPARRFVTGTAPEILVFEQRFEQPRPQVPHRTRVPRPRTTRPYHID